jgi:oligopeptide/dipeptide ABC transporter ATP-binding protein
MYLGRIVEIAEAHDLYRNPRHPYTRSLFAAAPSPNPARGAKGLLWRAIHLPPVNLPSGCRFRTRCPYVQAICPKSTRRTCK